MQLDQAELIYQKLSECLARTIPPMVLRVQTDTNLEVWSGKVVELFGQKRDGLYFAGLVKRRTYLSFYYMPIYMEPSFGAKLSPLLVACQSGKSCFHIKELDDALQAAIEDALELGVACFVDHGWA